jgi:hypothetical protein
MADAVRPALGLSIGATNLAAVTADLAIIRKPVLTLYRQRPPEVGVPSENPSLDEPGLVITDFVDRVGKPVGIVAADGSVHRSEGLVADALRALAYTTTGGRALPEHIAVTYPAHWPSKAVDTLGAALGGVPEWSNPVHPLLLIPDAAATLVAVKTNPGVRARGTVAVCDFGGSGTSITLMDAANYQAVAPTVRHHDFSGDMIDQALLTAVMANMPGTGSFDPFGKSAIGSLSRLRAGCRSAKEQLSSSTVTTLTDDLTSTRGDVRITRDELDDAIRESLDSFVAALDETLRRNKIRDLVAVVTAGGGANIPLVTTTLSGHLGVPVVTTPRPQVTAAIGAALRAARGSGDDTAAAPTAAASVTATATVSATARAWPQGGSATTATAEAPAFGIPAFAWSVGHHDLQTRPAPKSEPSEPPSSKPKKRVFPWSRLRAVGIIGAVAAILLVGIALTIELGSDDKPTTAPGTTTAPASPAPSTSAPPSNTTNPPATTDTPTTTAPPAVPEGPVTQAPAAPQAPAPPAPAARVAPAIPRIPAIPHLPPIPGINEPIPGLSGIPTLASLIAPRSR